MHFTMYFLNVKYVPHASSSSLAKATSQSREHTVYVHVLIMCAILHHDWDLIIIHKKSLVCYLV